MVIRIAGKRMYLWRRDKRAALRLTHKLLRQQGFVPKLLTTDKLVLLRIRF